MDQDEALSGYRRAFVARVKAAREARPYTQQQMADLLGIPQDQYKHYEGGRETYLPYHLIDPDFASPLASPSIG